MGAKDAGEVKVGEPTNGVASRKSRVGSPRINIIARPDEPCKSGSCHNVAREHASQGARVLEGQSIRQPKDPYSNSVEHARTDRAAKKVAVGYQSTGTSAAISRDGTSAASLNLATSPGATETKRIFCSTVSLAKWGRKRHLGSDLELCWPTRLQHCSLISTVACCTQAAKSSPLIPKSSSDRATDQCNRP